MIAVELSQSSVEPWQSSTPRLFGADFRASIKWRTSGRSYSDQFVVTTWPEPLHGGSRASEGILANGKDKL